MNQFIYDVLLKYIPREKFQVCLMDTDSAYTAFSGRSLRDCVRPEMKGGFFEKIFNSCHVEHVSPETGFWFPRECCNKHRQFDRRTPGLFKLEKSGIELYCLASKTYILHDGVNNKLSCKGVMKHRVENPLNIFQTVLLDGKSQEVENVGFRARHGTMFTYTQTKVGFNYLYIKRKLLSDGKSTVPLDICLTPRSFICHVLVDSKNALSNEYTETIKHANGISFQLLDLRYRIYSFPW